MRRLFIHLGILTLLLGTLVFDSAYAQNEFETRYDVIYDFEEAGEARVTQTIEIINNERDVIATLYTVQLSDKGIKDIQTKVNGNTTEPRIEETETGLNISLTIKDPVVGYNRSNIIELSYKTKSISTQTGDTYNIFVPKTLLTEGTTKYNVTIFAPKKWGPVIFISPTPKTKTEIEEKWLYTYEKEEVQYAGINAAFGNNQSINFELGYELQNTNLYEKTQEITLPTDKRGYQLVVIETITPEPKEIIIDKDGNRKAIYKLAANENKKISVKGYAKLSTKVIIPQQGGAFTEMPKNIQREYTKTQPYWDVDSLVFQDIAKQLRNENLSVSQNAHAAYNYIVNILTYDFDLINNTTTTRQGALAALEHKTKIGCMEFTDSLIALLRAMDIPAREINGYALTTHLGPQQPISLNLNGGDYLHAWPEYYDPAFGWVQIDPTWGNTSGLDYFTKLDAAHFTLVTKGQDSEEPKPAGAFKQDPNQKQLDIVYSEIVCSIPKPEILSEKAVLSLITKVFLKQKLYKITNSSIFTVYIENTGVEIPSHNSKYILVKKDEGEIHIKDPLQESYFFTLD